MNKTHAAATSAKKEEETKFASGDNNRTVPAQVPLEKPKPDVPRVQTVIDAEVKRNAMATAVLLIKKEPRQYQIRIHDFCTD